MQELLGQLSKIHRNDKKNLFFYSKEIKKLCTPKDILYLQGIAFPLSFSCSSPQEELEQLNNALEMTVPNFNFSNILNYQLSGDELCILNNICFVEFLLEPSNSIQHL